jgi:hypothetical protein
LVNHPHGRIATIIVTRLALVNCLLRFSGWGKHDQSRKTLGKSYLTEFVHARERFVGLKIYIDHGPSAARPGDTFHFHMWQSVTSVAQSVPRVCFSFLIHEAYCPQIAFFFRNTQQNIHPSKYTCAHPISISISERLSWRVLLESGNTNDTVYWCVV